jgi:hypothetical protein
VLGAAGVAVFLAVALLLARVLGVAGVERSAVVDAVKGQAAVLNRTGKVRVLNIKPTTRFALGGGTHVARVAWKAGDALPVVQCVTLRRDGGVLDGYDVRVLRVSRPIPRDANCPG